MTDISTALTDAQNGSEDGFRTLYQAVQPGLPRYLRVLVGADAEDVAAEAWLQVSRDLASFRGDGDGFRGWVTTIARNRAMDHLRRLRRRPVEEAPPENWADLPGATDTADFVVDASPPMLRWR